jgi:curved DNA-binding protein
MGQDPFRDYYEDLQVNPNADFEMIERVFRLLAKRYHPDNKQTGNTDKFDIIYKAYQILSDPEKRVAYDARYEQANASRWKIYDEASQSDGFEDDTRIRNGVLSLLYVSRRKDALNPGMGIMELEKFLGCPQQIMEFHIWYLKEKGWILRSDTGEYAITASGVDEVSENDLSLKKDRLLPETSEFSTIIEESKSSTAAGTPV